MIITKSCNTCEHNSPRDNHCISCVWDKDKGGNTKWENLIVDEVIKQMQKYGKWVNGVCDNCKYDWGKDAPIASVPNYCPNCGAKMESEDKE
jgi:hypothetical protein